MASELDAPQHRYRWLVKFSYGSGPTTLLLTDWEDGATVTGIGTFTAEPRLEVRPPHNTGNVEEQPFVVIVPEEVDALFTNLTSGYPHAPVTVEIFEEVFAHDGVSPVEQFRHFKGSVAKAYRNHTQRKGLVRLECLSVKSQLKVPLGIVANSQCPWAFGDKNCTVNTGPLEETGTVASITQNQIEVSGLTNPSARYWERGYFERDGLRITIRKWETADPTIFHLTSKAPPSWLAQNVTAVPGCDKTIETCRARWANEEHFGGIGYAIPSYQPLYESPL